MRLVRADAHIERRLPLSRLMLPADAGAVLRYAMIYHDFGYCFAYTLAAHADALMFAAATPLPPDIFDTRAAADTPLRRRLRRF